MGDGRSAYWFAAAMMLSLQVDRPAAAQQEATEREAPRAVYLDTSFEAEQALARVAQLEADGQWVEAAARLQQVSRDFGRHVIADGPGRYVSICEAVGRRISEWPSDGLAAYRTAFEPAARNALTTARRAGDIADLLAVGDEFFATRSGAEAMDLAAQFAMERGQFNSARQWLDQLLAHHPDRVELGAMWRAKSAVCVARLGDLSRLTALAEAHPAERPGASVRWAGREQSLGEFARGSLREIQGSHAEGSELLRAASEKTTTSIFCGAAHRRARFACRAAAEAVLWKFTAFGHQDETSDFAERSAGEPAYEDSYSRGLQTGLLLSMMPVEGGGLIYVQDGRSVWAVDSRDASRAVWMFEASSRDAAASAWLHDESVPPLHTLLYAGDSQTTRGAASPNARGGATEGRVYAHVEGKQKDIGEDAVAQATSGVALVCLDARSGAMVWRNDLESLGTAFEDASLDGAPILHDGDLYVVGRRRKSFGFEACFLLRLNAEDGQLLDMIHVGEAATGSYGYRRATIGHPAAEADRVFVQSNLGSIAAYASQRGRLIWIHTYESVLDKDSEMTWPDRVGRPVRSWSYQPVVCWRDAIICMPLDSTDVLILSQEDGRLIRRISGDAIERPEMILGVSEDRMYLVGSDVVCYDLAAGRVAWQRPLDTGQLLGRGALTDTGLLIPTDRGLLQYPLEGGRATVFRWLPEQAGHVLPLADQIVIAAPKLLYGLVGREDAFARMTQRMADAPDDPWIALSLAELAFYSADYASGLDAVEEAVRRLGGFARMTDAVARRRLFQRLMGLADSLLAAHLSAAAAPHDERGEIESADTGAQTQPLRAIEAAVTLLRMAGQCGPTPEDQVVQRFRLARLLVLAEDMVGAVEAYQQVLVDPGLRRVVLHRAESFEFLATETTGDGRDDEADTGRAGLSADSTRAGSFAAARIGALVRKQGPSVYEAVDQKARDRLRIARGMEDDAAILEVAEAFPNSSAATEARAVHARRMRASGELEAASRSFRGALADRRYSGRPELIREYAECLVAAGRPADAADWLARGVRDYPDYVISHDGGRDGFAGYRERLVGSRSYVNPSQAITVAPVTSTYDRLFPDRATVLEPLLAELPDTTWEDMLTAGAGQVDCRHPITGRSRWPRPFATRAQPILLGMDVSRYYLATVSRVFALTRTSGQLEWQFGDEPPDDPLVEPESLPSWVYFAVSGERLYAGNDRGRIVGLSLADGALRWSIEAGAAPAAPMVANDAYVCYAAAQGADLRIVVLDAADGRKVRTIQPADAWPLHQLMLTRKDRLLLVRSTTIQCIDVSSGESQWHVTAEEHFHLPTLQIDADAIYVSDDARRIRAYDLDEGRVLWRSAPIGPRADQGIWAQLANGSIYVACADRLQCLDAADGRSLWEASAPGCLKVQAPRLTADGVVTISPTDAARSRSGRREAADAAAQEEGRRYRIRRYRLATGSEMPLFDGGELVTGPIESLGGMILRDHAILLLDGSRLIGHVSRQQE